MFHKQSAVTQLEVTVGMSIEQIRSIAASQQKASWATHLACAALDVGVA